MADYRPLPSCLTIKTSFIEGLGLFATEPIEKGTNLGISHVASSSYQHGYIRTPIGAFYNHSVTPNCEKVAGSEKDSKVFYLFALREIRPEEEITVNYTLYDPTR